MPTSRRRKKPRLPTVVEMYVVRPTDPRFVLGMIEGDKKAMRFSEAIGHFLKELPDSKMLCVCCDNPLDPDHMPHAMLVQMPFMQNWQDGKCKGAMTGGICWDCARTKTDDQICSEVLHLMDGRPLAVRWPRRASSADILRSDMR